MTTVIKIVVGMLLFLGGGGGDIDAEALRTRGMKRILLVIAFVIAVMIVLAIIITILATRT